VVGISFALLRRPGLGQAEIEWRGLTGGPVILVLELRVSSKSVEGFIPQHSIQAGMIGFSKPSISSARLRFRNG